MSQFFAHMELRSPDLKMAEAFYAKMFGWKYKKDTATSMPYALVETGGLPSAGLMQAEPDGTPHWLPYLFVPDVEAALKQAQALGATVRMGAREIPGYGTAAVLADPAGSPFAIFKPNM